MFIIGIDSPLNISTSTTLNKDKIEFYSSQIQTSTRLISDDVNVLRIKKFNTLNESTSSNSDIDILPINHSVESVSSFQEYDLNIKLPVKKSLKRRMKIKSVKKFTPKVFFD